MTDFEIHDNVLDNIKDQVVVITGASSGIGLATVRRVIKHGGKVFASDLNPLPSPEASIVPFCKVDVTDWKSQLDMFKAAIKEYGHIDHVLANAGISTTETLLEEELDENGDLLPPKLKTVAVNYTGCLYTVKLALHYLQKNPKGGSIVMTASETCFSRLPGTDYSSTKHAVLGILRSLTPILHPKRPIRINAIAPGLTESGLVTEQVIDALGTSIYQSADAPAKTALLCMADSNRHGELIYSHAERFRELEGAFHENMTQFLGWTETDVAAHQIMMKSLGAIAEHMAQR